MMTWSVSLGQEEGHKSSVHGAIIELHKILASTSMNYYSTE